MGNRKDFFRKELHLVWIVFLGAVLSVFMVLLLLSMYENPEFLTLLRQDSPSVFWGMFYILSMPLMMYLIGVFEARAEVEGRSQFYFYRIVSSFGLTLSFCALSFYYYKMTGLSVLLVLLTFLMTFGIGTAGYVLGNTWKRIISRVQ